MNSFEVNSEGEEEDGHENDAEDDYTEDSAGSDGTNKSDSGSDFENINSDVLENELSDGISNDEESSSDSDPSSIIPVHHPPERLNEVFDEEFHIMERISPEPGM